MFRAPQVYFEGETVRNLKAELARGLKMKCIKCSLKGAALGCYVKSCRRSYHVPCAREMSKCRWDNVCFATFFTFSSAYLNNTYNSSKCNVNFCWGLYRKTFFCFVRLILLSNSRTRNLDIARPELSPSQKCIKSLAAYFDKAYSIALFFL